MKILLRVKQFSRKELFGDSQLVEFFSFFIAGKTSAAIKVFSVATVAFLGKNDSSEFHTKHFAFQAPLAKFGSFSNFTLKDNLSIYINKTKQQNETKQQNISTKHATKYKC